MALAEQHKLHQGISALGDVALNAHDWVNVGSLNRGLIEVLKANPHPVPGAKDAGGMTSANLLKELLSWTT